LVELGRHTADAAARVTAEAVTARRLCTRYTVGRDAALITRMARAHCPTGPSTASSLPQGTP